MQIYWRTADGYGHKYDWDRTWHALSRAYTLGRGRVRFLLFGWKQDCHVVRRYTGVPIRTA